MTQLNKYSTHSFTFLEPHMQHLHCHLSSSVCFEGQGSIYLPLTCHGPHFMPLLLALGLSVHSDAKTGK